MPFFSSPFDGARLFYRDYRPRPSSPTTTFCVNPEYQESDKRTLVFLHGWPYSSLSYEEVMVALCETYRLRCIAPDRRGFGQSEWSGPDANALQKEVDYNVFADDTIHLISSLLELESFVLVGSSMGAGESLLAWSRSTYVQEHCKGFIWICASLPHPVQSAQNPLMPPQEVWDGLLAGFRQSRAEFTRTALPGALVHDEASQLPSAVWQRYEYIVGEADALAIERCIQIITSYDFRPLLEKEFGDDDRSLPTVLCLHGQFDIGMPYEASSKVIKEIVPRAQVKVYDGAAHALQVTNRDLLIQDIINFVLELPM